VARRFPRSVANQEDVFQDVCLKLIEEDYRRIRAYDGHGSFTGYVLTVVERVLIDLMRREAPRRRLPAAVARLSAVDQAVYAAVIWENCPRDVTRLHALLRSRLDPSPDPEAIGQALERLAKLPQFDSAPPSGPDEISLDADAEGEAALSVADDAPDPEAQLLLAEEQKTRARLVAAMKEEAAKLPPEDRLYLQIVFGANEPLPAREIAKLMGCAVENVYRLKQRAQRFIADLASKFKKNAGPSV
jgi:RNA polymerase primary sigma factor